MVQQNAIDVRVAKEALIPSGRVVQHRRLLSRRRQRVDRGGKVVECRRSGAEKIHDDLLCLVIDFLHERKKP